MKYLLVLSLFLAKTYNVSAHPNFEVYHTVGKITVCYADGGAVQRNDLKILFTLLKEADSTLFNDSAIIYVCFWYNRQNQKNVNYEIEYKDSNFSWASWENGRDVKRDYSHKGYKSIQIYCYNEFASYKDMLKLIWWGLKVDAAHEPIDYPDKHVPLIERTLFSAIKDVRIEEILKRDYPAVNSITDQKYYDTLSSYMGMHRLIFYYKDDLFYLNNDYKRDPVMGYCEFAVPHISDWTADTAGNYVVFTGNSVFYYLSFVKNKKAGPFILPRHMFSYLRESEFAVKGDTIIVHAQDGQGDFICNIKTLSVISDTNSIDPKIKSAYMAQIHADRQLKFDEQDLARRPYIVMVIFVILLGSTLFLLKYKG